MYVCILNIFCSASNQYKYSGIVNPHTIDVPANRINANNTGTNMYTFTIFSTMIYVNP